MPANYLSTAPPRSGKTIVLQNVVDRLDTKGGPTHSNTTDTIIKI